MLNDLLLLMKNEWLLAGIILLLLILKITDAVSRNIRLPLIQLFLLIYLISGFFFNQDGQLFGNMFKTNSLIQTEKSILALGVYLISLLFSGCLRQSDHWEEFFILMLSALLGMNFMLSSGNLLMLFLSLELATIPVAAMVNFDLDKKQSAEAAMKMIMSSAFSSGILLFGISFIYGITGTLDMDSISQQWSDSPLAITSFIFLIAAFAFKLSVVPFHLWTADVYQGAPYAATAFLSVISKAATAFVLISLLYRVFDSMQDIGYHLLILLGMITVLVGNLFAVRQDNLKRFLAFSSIAQVGFILVGISSGMLTGTPAVLFFLLIYTFSNLAAFAVASIIGTQTGKENISDMAGFYKQNPVLSWTLVIALFSLAGIPPTAGFFGKLFLITSAATKASYGLIIFMAANMVIALYYYLKVVKTIFSNAGDSVINKLTISFPVRLGLIICGAGILLTGFLGWLYEYFTALLVTG